MNKLKINKFSKSWIRHCFVLAVFAGIALLSINVATQPMVSAVPAQDATTNTDALNASDYLVLAKDYCVGDPVKPNSRSKHPVTACRQGYVAAYAGKNKSAACDGFKSGSDASLGDLHTCQAAYDAAAKLVPASQSQTLKDQPDPAIKGCTSNDCDFVKKYINPAVLLLTFSFGLIAVVSLIIGGIQYSASQGDPQNVAKAKKRIADTLLAVVAYFFLFTFLQFLIPGGLFHR